MTDTFEKQVKGSRDSFCELFIFEGQVGLSVGDGVVYLDRAAHQRLNVAIQNGFTHLGATAPIPEAHISLIRRMSMENPGWGEDRIADELQLKLGITHSTSTIRKYIAAELQEAITGEAAEYEDDDFDDEEEEEMGVAL